MEPQFGPIVKREPIKAWSWVLLVFTTLSMMLVAWLDTKLLASQDFTGFVTEVILNVLLYGGIAYAVKGRKSKRNWNAFARWYFWLFMILGGIAYNAHHYRETSVVEKQVRP